MIRVLIIIKSFISLKYSIDYLNRYFFFLINIYRKILLKYSNLGFQYIYFIWTDFFLSKKKKIEKTQQHPA